MKRTLKIAFLILSIVGLGWLSSDFTSDTQRFPASETALIRIFNDDLRVLQVGSGKDLVFIHGTPGSIEDWWPSLVTLSDKYRLTFFDRPGHGASSKSRKSELNYSADIARELMTKLSLHKVTVIGHSYGGSIALKLAEQNPPQVDNYILIGTPAFGVNAPGLTYKISTWPLIGTIFNCCVARFFAPGEMKKALGSLFLGQPPEGFVEFRSKIWSRPRQLKSHAEEYLALNKDLEDLTPGLSKISRPILIVVGEQDKEKTILDAKKLNKLIPKSKIKIIPDSGHYVQIEKSQVLMNEIHKFIDKN